MDSPSRTEVKLERGTSPEPNKRARRAASDASPQNNDHESPRETSEYRNKTEPDRSPSPRRASPSPRRASSPSRRRASSPSPRRASPSPRRTSPSRRTRSPPPRDRSLSPSKGREIINLKSGETAYILGRGGQTKKRLSNFSGAILEVDPKGRDSVVEIVGTDKQRELARLCIDITLMQRNNGRLSINFRDLESREDCDTLDVDREAVGFVMGSKGATLRELETRYRTFMFFDNEALHDGKKRLYILGSTDARAKAIKECQSAISYKMNGDGSYARSWRDKNRSSNRRHSSPSRRRSRSPRRRSRSPVRRHRSRSPRRSPHKSGTGGAPSKERRPRDPSPSRSSRKRGRSTSRDSRSSK